MALIKCQECGEEISDQAAVCPHCGYPVKKIERKAEIKVSLKRKVLPLVLAIMLIALAVFAALYIKQSSEKKIKQDIYNTLTGDH